MTNVVPVAEARDGLSRTLKAFRSDPHAAPIVIGSHRKPEAVLMSIADYERSVAEASAVSLECLRMLAPLIARLAAISHLTDVRVYGSVARGDHTRSSDVDLLVTPLDGATLFDTAQFEMDLELLLGTAVSVTPITALDEARDASLLRESIAL